MSKNTTESRTNLLMAYLLANSRGSKFTLESGTGSIHVPADRRTGLAPARKWHRRNTQFNQLRARCMGRYTNAQLLRFMNYQDPIPSHEYELMVRVDGCNGNDRVVTSPLNRITVLRSGARVPGETQRRVANPEYCCAGE